MISSDREILLDIQGMQFKQHQEYGEFQAIVLKRLDNLDRELIIIKHDQANLQTSVYWVLGAVGIFLAALGIPAIIASMLSVFKKPEPQSDNQNITNSLIDAFMKGLTLGRGDRK